MRMKQWLFIIVGIVFLVVQVVSADIVYKRDGTKVKGNVLVEDDTGVTIDVKGKSLFFPWGKVNRVVKGQLKGERIIIPPWQKSITFGLTGFLTSYSGMTSTSLGFSLGYWPRRMIEYGGGIRIDVSKSSFEGGEFTSVANTYSGYTRIYFFPLKGNVRMWAENKRGFNPFKLSGIDPFKYRMYFGLALGVTTTGNKSSFGSISSDETKTEFAVRFEVLGIQWRLKRNVAVNFSVLAIDRSGFNTSASLRLTIPVVRK